MKSMLTGAFISCLQLFSAVLALSACAEQDLVITGDTKIELYVDGVRQTLANANNWRISDTVKIPASARVIAVKAEDDSAQDGILASGADFVTDRSWKCTATLTQGWEAASFDDSRWSAARIVGKHGDRPWGKIAGIGNDALWIWTRRSSDKVVYCRKTLSPCDSCAGTGTGPVCITSCEGRKDGDYQSCKGCNVYATCSNGILSDDRQCTPSAPGAPSLVWDDTLKRCEFSSKTCKTCVSNGNESPGAGTGTGTGAGTGPGAGTGTGTGTASDCISSCEGRLDGDYQSCRGCNVYATCSNGILSDERPCALNNPPLAWDDKKKRCELESATCT